MPHTVFPALTQCELCRNPGELQRSHLLPNFLFRRLRQGARGYFAASRPRRRTQSGGEVRLLCHSCEQSLSRWEQATQRVFFANHTNPSLPINYGPWLFKFAISVSWRALTFLRYAQPNPHIRLDPTAERLLPTLNDAHHEAANAALAAWSSRLLEQGGAECAYEQHWIFLNGQNVPHERSEVVGFTVYETDDAAGVFTQMGPICLLGLIHNACSSSWLGTRVEEEGGSFPAAAQVVPPSFAHWLAHYFQDIEQLSPR